MIDDKKLEIIELYKNKVSIKNIALKMGCSSYPIRRILNNYDLIRKVKRKHKQVNRAIIQQIIKMHEADVACGDIASELKVDIWTVNYHLRKNNIKPKNLVSNEKASVSNEFSFKNMTKEKAFILGVIFGDGHVAADRITIYGSKKDIDTLNKINVVFESKCSIFEDKRSDNGIYLRINKKKLSEELRNDFQLKSNKSNSLVFPSLEENFIPAFVSGFLAADGSIMMCDKKRNYLRICFGSCTYSFLKNIQKYFCNILNIKENKIVTKNPKGISKKPMYYVIFNCSNAEKICKYLYDNTTEITRSDRKFQVYLDYLQN